MNRALNNGIAALGALAIPLLAEYITASPGEVPGTGFDVLLYEPFDFAYILLVTAIFVSLNIWSSALQIEGSKLQGALLGVLLAIGWFFVSFLLVGQLHISLGGKL
jgi:hypothetical protein